MLTWRGQRTYSPARTAADVVRVLSRSECLDILSALAGAQADVSTLSRLLRRSMPIVSRSLGLLRTAQLVSFEQDENHRIYRLTGSVSVESADHALEISIPARDGSCVTVRQPRRGAGGSRRTALGTEESDTSMIRLKRNCAV